MNDRKGNSHNRRRRLTGTRSEPDDGTRGPALERGTATSDEAIDLFAERYQLDTPLAWRQWCLRNGWLRQSDAGWELLGLTPAPSGLDAAAMLAGIRFTMPGFPAQLIPIERLPERQLACLNLNGSNDPPVVIVDLDDPQTWDHPQAAASGFRAYAKDFTAQAVELRRLSGFLRHQRREIESGRRPADQAPRPDEWRAYRFCSQNVVVAVVLLRFNRDGYALDVGACLTAALSRLDPDAPARALCTMLFAEAYRSGGDLSVRFVRGTRRDAENGQIPAAIGRWARRVGTALDEASGIIPSDLALRLFISSVRVSSQLGERLRELPPASAAAICHGIASGLWHPAEVETVLAWANDPAVVLRGATDPIDRARYAGDILDVRAGMLIAAAFRRIAAGSEDSRLDAEDVQQQVDLTVESNRTCRLTGPRIDLSDWTIGEHSVFPCTSLRICVADAEPDQLPSAIEAALRRLDGFPGEVTAVLCPKDVLMLSDGTLNDLVLAARESGVLMLAGPDYTPSLAVRATDKLSRARTARQ